MVRYVERRMCRMDPRSLLARASRMLGGRSTDPILAVTFGKTSTIHLD